MFLILVANNAMDGTLQPYRPAIFRTWQAGAWARGTWGMNDEFSAASPPTPGGGAVIVKQHHKKATWIRMMRRVS